MADFIISHLLNYLNNRKIWKVIKYNKKENSSRGKIMKKTIVLFIAFFIFISVFHIYYNADIIARPPSFDWSRDVDLQSIKFNRTPLAGIDDDNNVLLVYPYENGEGKVGVNLYDEKLELVKDEVVDIEELNFNKISKDEIFVYGSRIYWRDNLLNKVYMGRFDDGYKKIDIFSEIDNVSRMSVYSGGEFDYLAYVDKDDIFIANIKDGSVKTIEGPKNQPDIKDIKVFKDSQKIYLQFAKKDKDSGYKEIFVSECDGENWTKPLMLNKINEVKISIKDMSIFADDVNVYSIVTIQGDDKSSFTYIVDGYNKSTKDVFETLRLNNVMKYGVGNFSSTPVAINSTNEGIELITTAPTTIDMYSRNASNVLKLLLDDSGIKKVKLLSKTKSWSNRPNYIRGNYEYIFWNESEEGCNQIKGATTEKTVLNRTTNKTREIIAEAIGEEVPVLISFNFLLSFGGRLISIFPAIMWLVYIFIYNEKLQKKQDKMFLIGIAIFYIFQLMSVKDFYVSQAIIFMPEALKISGAKFIYPTIFTTIGWLGANLYKKSANVKEGYKVYSTFLVVSYILMNHLYSPYLFK